MLLSWEIQRWKLRGEDVRGFCSQRDPSGSERPVHPWSRCCVWKQAGVRWWASFATGCGSPSDPGRVGGWWTACQLPGACDSHGFLSPHPRLLPPAHSSPHAPRTFACDSGESTWADCSPHCFTGGCLQVSPWIHVRSPFPCFQTATGTYCSPKYWLRLAHDSTLDWNTRERFCGRAGQGLSPHVFLRKYLSALVSVPFPYLICLSFHPRLLYFLYSANLYSAYSWNFLCHSLSRSCLINFIQKLLEDGCLLLVGICFSPSLTGGLKNIYFFTVSKSGFSGPVLCCQKCHFPLPPHFLRALGNQIFG